MAGIEMHVVQRFLRGAVLRCGNGRVHGDGRARVRAPGQGRADVACVDDHVLVEARAFIAGELRPARLGGFERGALRCAWRVRHPRVGHFVRCDHAGACTGFDGHVAQGHALLHVHRADGGAAVFQHVAGAAVHADHADDVQDHVLGADAGCQRAVDGDRHGFRFALQQALRGQHVANFAGADAEGQRSERAMRGGVAVAAHDRHAGLGQAQFRCDHVDDAALGRLHVEQFDAVFGAVAGQRIDLGFRSLGEVVELAVGVSRRGRCGMVHGRLGAVRPARRDAACAQLGERLWRSHFMDQVQVDVQHRGRGVGLGNHDVRVPEFVEQGAWGGGHALVFRCFGACDKHAQH